MPGPIFPSPQRVDEAFRELYPRLTSFAKAHFPEVNPDDAVQDGITRFLENPPSYIDLERLFYLLCNAIRWAVLDSAKKARGKSKLLTNAEGEIERQTKDELPFWIFKEDLVAAIETLDRRERQILTLRSQSMTYDNIANLLSCCTRTVRNCHKQALMRLASILD